MRKFILGLMLMISVTTSYARKTDWSKVGLSSTNKCNEYTFKLTGVSDTNCMSYRFVEITTVSSQVLLRRQNGSSTYNITFPSKGKYYATVLIMNKCNGDDTVFVDTINVTCFPTTIKCDWSYLKFTQSNNRNYYRFKLSGDGLGDDTCVGWMFMVYDQQTKKIDTLEDFKGYTDVTFNVKGKYKLYVKIWNTCEKCDTVFYREINIQYFDKVGFSKTKKSCKNFIYEIAPQTTVKGDTCYNYYYYIYSGKFFNSFTKGEWDSITTNQLYTLYDFPDTDLDTIHDNRLFNYTYPKEGRYLVINQVFNWCNYQDTFLMSKVTIDCNSSSIKNIVKTEDLKIVGYYDVLGRQMEYMEPEKVYIVRYSNGKSQKVVRLK